MSNIHRTRSMLVVAAAVVLSALIVGGLHAAGSIRLAMAAGNTATIVDYAFQPATITINQHETLTWTNTGASNHTVTADDGTSFDSGSLSNGDVFANLFETAGTFKYHCSIHPDRMQGTIIVKAVAATPTPSGSPRPTPPPGTLPPDFKTPVPVVTPEPTGPPLATPAASGGSGGSATGSKGPIIAIALVGAAIAATAWLAVRRRRGLM